MSIDKNQLKTLINKAKSNEMLVLLVDSLDKNGYKIYQNEIDKFVKKDQDYVLVAIKR